ncbi:MAG: T9SS type A sorting domain-containing protein [Flavobacteriia bacterium]|jgi:hypothetical protein
MKRIILFCSIILTFQSFTQEVWENIPVNPVLLPNAKYDFELVDGKLYQFINQDDGGGAGPLNLVYKYDNITSSWQFQSFVNSTVLTKLVTQKIGSKVYLVGYDGANFSFWRYDNLEAGPAGETQDYPAINVNNNWQFETGNGNQELYLLYTVEAGATDEIHGLERNPGFTWKTMNAESSSSDLSQADLQIQVTQNDVYFGVYTTRVRATRFQKGQPSITIFPYEGIGTGIIQSNGADWDNSGFVLTGNKNTYISFYGTEDANNKSYEYEMDGNTVIDVDWASQSITDFNIDANYIAKESSPSHSFIFSSFRNDGVAAGGTNDIVKVIRRDISASGAWENAGPNILTQGTAIEQNSLSLSIDNGYHHLAASYILQGNTTPELKVLNQTPFVYVGSTAANSGLCANQLNEIYSNIEIEDVDFDQITIISATSLNSQTTNIQVIPNGFSNGISKFKILGIPNANSDQIQIYYTDGFGFFTADLDVFQAITPPVNVQFVANPLILCSNEIQIDLSEKVNYYDQGFFRLNGQNMNNSILNGFLQNTIANTGTLNYTVNINGCVVTANANYQIVNPPSATILSNPTSCGSNTGDATLTITAGTSSNFSFYWSTGETTNFISNLSPGAYYAHVIDDNSCKATAIATIEASDVTIIENNTNPSCFGKEDGTIDLTITSTDVYHIIWSTGRNAEDLISVVAGTYEYTYFGDNGCQITKSVTLANPSQLTNVFIPNKPDCGQTNGSILTNVNGGVLPYNYLWNTSDASPNITNLDNGFYQVEITDANGCKIVDSLFLNDNYAAIITDSIIHSACNANNGGINISLTQHPLGGPVNSISWNSGQTTEDIYNLSTGVYVITVNSDINCIAQKAFTINTRGPLRNDICIVTVDTATTTNLVVWEKIESEGIAYYNIYRENTIAGDYMLIDTVHFSNFSVFNDVVASPENRSWRYRISAVNTCGVEGPLSANHKTLHLNTINQITPGLVDVYWDNYEGITSGQYNVYRYTDQTDWVALTPPIPYGNPTMITDNVPLNATGLDYFVDFELSTPCEPSNRAQDFNRTRSNKERGIFNPGDGAEDYSNNEIVSVKGGDFSINVYPNPFENELFITLKGLTKSQIQLIDIQGKNIAKYTCKEGLNTFSTQNLESGIYFLKTEINGEVVTMKIIK